MTNLTSACRITFILEGNLARKLATMFNTLVKSRNIILDLIAIWANRIHGKPRKLRDLTRGAFLFISYDSDLEILNLKGVMQLEKVREHGGC